MRGVSPALVTNTKRVLSCLIYGLALASLDIGLLCRSDAPTRRRGAGLLWTERGLFVGILSATVFFFSVPDNQSSLGRRLGVNFSPDAFETIFLPYAAWTGIIMGALYVCVGIFRALTMAKHR